MHFLIIEVLSPIRQLANFLYCYLCIILGTRLHSICDLADVSLQSPVVQFVLSPHAGYSCERVRVSGISRLHLKHYSSSLHVMLKAFDGIPEKLHGKIEVCSHR